MAHPFASPDSTDYDAIKVSDIEPLSLATADQEIADFIRNKGSGTPKNRSATQRERVLRALDLHYGPLTLGQFTVSRVELRRASTNSTARRSRSEQGGVATGWDSDSNLRMAVGFHYQGTLTRTCCLAGHVGRRERPPRTHSFEMIQIDISRLIHEPKTPDPPESPGRYK